MLSLWSNIYATFIMQDRYLFFVEGLKATLALTFGSFLLGTLTGVLLCAAFRSKNTLVQRIARLIASFFVEMPTLVLLMILVYVIFGRSALPILWVITVGLTLKAGAYLSQIFDTALSTVDSGEIEAARTLGMSKWQAFRYIALPQTVTAALPLYQNQFIVTMQETSVVGYLAVVDLTQAASIISSRTLDALFGLIAVAVLYFIIGNVVKLLFRLLIAAGRRGGEAA